MGSDSVLADNVKSFLSGGFGGVCAVVTGHPFDFTKVLLQTNQYSSLSGAIKGTLAAHGPLGFYKGVTSPLLGVTPMFAISFWGYDLGKRLVRQAKHKSEDAELTIGEISAAGFLSAIPMTLVSAPFERVKVVMQVDKQSTSFSRTVRNLYSRGGVRSIYKGAAATLARDGPGSAIYFATYEYLKEKWQDKTGGSSIKAIMMAGGCAGLAMWVTIFPVDTVKSVQQSSHGSLTMAQTARAIYANKGVGGFFPGLVPSLARSFPANAATFLGVEMARQALDKVM